MNTKITFTYKDIPYTLEYDRNSITRMEDAGFDIQNFMSKPMLNIDLAFKGAFLKNHRTTKEAVINEIYTKFSDKDSLIATLVTMINETYETLFDSPAEGDSEGNIKWDIAGSL